MFVSYCLCSLALCRSEAAAIFIHVSSQEAEQNRNYRVVFRQGNNRRGSRRLTGQQEVHVFLQVQEEQEANGAAAGPCLPPGAGSVLTEATSG